MTNLYIPKKIRVGFQQRKDTFTGKLAFIVYFDDKNILKQEKSWNNWRDQKIEYIDFDNTPRNNYVFNKGVQRSGHWGSGRSVIRVYDPRDFEFEIDVENLIGILMHSDVSKRDIVEECVFAWSGNKLILLPVNSDDYQASVEYTAKQGQNVTVADLVPGKTYSHKKLESSLTYLGYYHYFEMNRWNDYEQVPKGKNHVFYDGKEFIKVNVESLASVLSDEINQEFSNLLENFLQSNNGATLLKLEIKPSTIENQIHYKDLKKGFLMKIIIKKNVEKLKLHDLQFTPYYFTVKEKNNIKEIRRDYYDSVNYDKYLNEERTKVNIYLNKKYPNELSYTQEQMLKCLTDLKYGQLFMINRQGQSVHKAI